MKWVKRIIVGLLALIVLILVIIYVGGELVINRHYEPVAKNMLTSSRPDVLSRGERLSRVFGCLEGCHGKEMEGAVFFEQFALARLVAPNLTRAVDQYSTAEMEAIIRQGIRPDGTSVLAMPSDSFSYLTDNDLSAILSFIKSYPKQENDLGRSSYSVLARFGLLTGEFQPAAKVVQSRSAPGNQAGLASLDPGEYIAMTSCSECHGMDLGGDFGPDLVIAKAYTLEDFQTLMKTGVGVGGRDLGLMSEVSKSRFNHLLDDEIENLHAWLQTR